MSRWGKIVAFLLVIYVLAGIVGAFFAGDLGVILGAIGIVALVVVLISDLFEWLAGGFFLYLLILPLISACLLWGEQIRHFLGW